MKTILALAVLLYSAAAIAQTASSPNSQPGPSPEAAPMPKPASPPKPKSTAARLKACLKIADGTRGRLDCDDKIFPPQPNPRAEPAKSVAECRFLKEQDERLGCYNSFVANAAKPNPQVSNSPPPAPASAPTPAPQPKPAPPPKPRSTADKLKDCLAIEDGSKERLDCNDAIFPPKPNPRAKAAKAVTECRFQREQDQRLACYNGFADSTTKPNESASSSPPQTSPPPSSPPPISAPPASPPPKLASPPKPQSSKPPQSVAKKLQACLEIPDGSVDRLNCDDAIFAPKPNSSAKPAKGVADCRFIREQDERLACYNGFAESIPQFSE